jgi:hypothetical protein
MILYYNNIKMKLKNSYWIILYKIVLKEVKNGIDKDKNHLEVLKYQI